jgi:hypothetical protein
MPTCLGIKGFITFLKNDRFRYKRNGARGKVEPFIGMIIVIFMMSQHAHAKKGRLKVKKITIIIMIV